MERKYYTCEQILDALSEVGVGAGDTSEVLSYLSRLPSAEPIEKQAMYKAIKDASWSNVISVDRVLKLVEDMPSAQTEQKTGKWIVDDEYIDCSCCRREKWSRTPYEQLVSRFRFCPNCGAKMEVEDD